MNRDFLLGQLEDQGFGVCRNLFTVAEVCRMRESFSLLEERAREFPTGGICDGAVFFVQGERIERVCWCGACAPYLLEVGRDERMCALIRAVLGTDSCDHLINQAHFKLPGDGVAFPWHQDSQHRRYGTDLWRDVTGRGSFLQIVVAVDAAKVENGCLHVFPGTHRLGHVNLPDGGIQKLGLQESEALPVELEAGDAVLFGPYLIHGSYENTSATPRRALVNGYAAPGANKCLYPGHAAGAGSTLPL